MTAKYLVTIPPGAQVLGVGFVKAGDVFTAPSDDYVPSRTFIPVNEAAVGPVKKALDAHEAVLEARLTKATKDDAKEQIRAQLEELKKERAKRTAPMELPRDEPKVEPGLSLKELGELGATTTEPKKPSAPQKGGDRKL